MVPPHLPRPPYLTDAWFAAQGVADPEPVLSAMRPEEVVMAPDRLRALKATRLSFSRSLLRRMAREGWTIRLAECRVDAAGDGHLFYAIEAAGHRAHFVVRSRPAAGADRQGRFYETEFDLYGAMMDGPLDPARAQAELDEYAGRSWGGRTDGAAFGWTVANRSNRFFDYLVDELAAGRQPDPRVLATGGGYVVRNAGWYGNGRHGSRSWLSIPPDHPFAYPYHLDLLALYLWRVAGTDLAQAMARERAPGAATLGIETRRMLGIGNSSGIGMVAALVRWPAWLGGFVTARELALAFATTRPAPIPADRVARFAQGARESAAMLGTQPDCAVEEICSPARLADELARAADAVAPFFRQDPAANWAGFLASLDGLHPETVEQLHAVLIDGEPDLCDAVAALIPAALAIPRAVEARMSVSSLKAVLRERYGWALALDLAAPGAREYFWYRSEENGENRRGERAQDPGVENETFVDVAGAVQALRERLVPVPDATLVAEWLVGAQDLVHVVSRVQLAARLPYTEIRANIVDRDFLPMDGIRFLLGTMGLDASHPNNTRWVRGVFFHGAPLPEDIAAPRGAAPPGAAS